MQKELMIEPQQNQTLQIHMHILWNILYHHLTIPGNQDW